MIRFFLKYSSATESNTYLVQNTCIDPIRKKASMTK